MNRALRDTCADTLYFYYVYALLEGSFVDLGGLDLIIQKKIYSFLKWDDLQYRQ